jgi:hypothetical protein
LGSACLPQPLAFEGSGGQQESIDESQGMAEMATLAVIGFDIGKDV